MLATDEATVAMPPLSNFSQVFKVFKVFANLSWSFGLSWLFKLFRLSCSELSLCFGPPLNGIFKKFIFLYLNTKGSKGDISLDLEVLFEYISGGTSAIGKKTNNELVKLIDGYVVEFNRSDTWRKGYMTLELLMQDKYKAGLAKGEEKGEKKAQAKAKEEKAQIVKNLYLKQISIETISECTGLKPSEVQKIISAK